MHGGGQGGRQGEAALSQEVQDKDVVYAHAQPDDNLQEVHEWPSDGDGEAGHQVGGQEQREQEGEQGDCDDVPHLGAGGGVAGPKPKVMLKAPGEDDSPEWKKSMMRKAPDRLVQRRIQLFTSNSRSSSDGWKIML